MAAKVMCVDYFNELTEGKLEDQTRPHRPQFKPQPPSLPFPHITPQPPNNCCEHHGVIHLIVFMLESRRSVIIVLSFRQQNPMSTLSPAVVWHLVGGRFARDSVIGLRIYPMSTLSPAVVWHLVGGQFARDSVIGLRISNVNSLTSCSVAPRRRML